MYSDSCLRKDCGPSGSCINGVCRCGTNAPCSGNSDTCISGVCKCGLADACGISRDFKPPTDNICDKGQCRCGANSQCDKQSIKPACLDVDGNQPSVTDTGATCKVIITFPNLFCNFDHFVAFQIKYDN